MATILSWQLGSGRRGRAIAARTLGRLCRGVPVRSRYGVLIYPEPGDATNIFALVGSYGSIAGEVLELERGIVADLYAEAAAPGFGPTVEAAKLHYDEVFVALNPRAPTFQQCPKGCQN